MALLTITEGTQFLILIACKRRMMEISFWMAEWRFYVLGSSPL